MKRIVESYEDFVRKINENKNTYELFLYEIRYESDTDSRSIEFTKEKPTDLYEYYNYEYVNYTIFCFEYKHNFTIEDILNGDTPYESEEEILETYDDIYEYIESLDLDEYISIFNENDALNNSNVISTYEIEDKNKGVDKHISDVQLEWKRRINGGKYVGYKGVRKYDTVYVDADGNMFDTPQYDEDVNEITTSKKIRIANHTHNPQRADDIDLFIVITNDDPTAKRFYTTSSDLVFTTSDSVDTIVDSIVDYFK
jgi:hypothetical protein